MTKPEDMDAPPDCGGTSRNRVPGIRRDSPGFAWDFFGAKIAARL